MRKDATELHLLVLLSSSPRKPRAFKSTSVKTFNEYFNHTLFYPRFKCYFGFLGNGTYSATYITSVIYSSLVLKLELVHDFELSKVSSLPAKNDILSLSYTTTTQTVADSPVLSLTFSWFCWWDSLIVLRNSEFSSILTSSSPSRPSSQSQSILGRLYSTCSVTRRHFSLAQTQLGIKRNVSYKINFSFARFSLSPQNDTCSTPSSGRHCYCGTPNKQLLPVIAVIYETTEPSADPFCESRRIYGSQRLSYKCNNNRPDQKQPIPPFSNPVMKVDSDASAPSLQSSSNLYSSLTKISILPSSVIYLTANKTNSKLCKTNKDTVQFYTVPWSSSSSSSSHSILGRNYLCTKLNYYLYYICGCFNYLLQIIFLLGQKLPYSLNNLSACDSILYVCIEYVIYTSARLRIATSLVHTKATVGSSCSNCSGSNICFQSNNRADMSNDIASQTNQVKKYCGLDFLSVGVVFQTLSQFQFS